MQEKENITETWRWEIIRKVAEYINQPDDLNMSELKEKIDSYRNYHKIKSYITTNHN